VEKYWGNWERGRVTHISQRARKKWERKKKIIQGKKIPETIVSFSAGGRWRRKRTIPLPPSSENMEGPGKKKKKSLDRKEADLLRRLAAEGSIRRKENQRDKRE